MDEWITTACVVCVRWLGAMVISSTGQAHWELLIIITECNNVSKKVSLLVVVTKLTSVKVV